MKTPVGMIHRGFTIVSQLGSEDRLKSLVLNLVLKLHFCLYPRLKKRLTLMQEQYSTSNKPLVVAPVLTIVLVAVAVVAAV